MTEMVLSFYGVYILSSTILSARGGLDENGPICSCLNTWSPAGGTIWKTLGCMAWLEEVCHEGSRLPFLMCAILPVWIRV